MKQIEVNLIRSEKRGKKIILVFESDLFSDQVFAVTPFYDEGDNKNQLQAVHFELKVTEKAGKIEAKVDFASCLTHYTKGHRQLHYPLKTFYLDKKDCTRNWANTETEEYLTDERCNQVLAIWMQEPEFQKEIIDIIDKRREFFKSERIKIAKENLKKALRDLETAIEN